MFFDDRKLIQQAYKNTLNHFNIPINEKKLNTVTEINKQTIANLLILKTNNSYHGKKKYEKRVVGILSSTSEIYNHLENENKEILLNTDIKKEFINKNVLNKIYNLKKKKNYILQVFHIIPYIFRIK